MIKQLRTTMESLDALQGQLKDKEDALARYFKVSIAWQVRLSQLALSLEATPAKDMPLDTLQGTNAALYQEMHPDSYATSYLNPVYASETLGDLSKGLSSLYFMLRKAIPYAFKGKFEALNDLSLLLKTVFEDYQAQVLTKASLSGHLKAFHLKYAEQHFVDAVLETMSPQATHYTEAIMKADLTDLKYLYAFGDYISPYELQTAKFLQSYPEERITHMAKHIVKAYVEGFKRDNKDITLRHHVKIVGVLGQERLTKAIVKELVAYDLIGFVGELDGTAINKQVAYDHKFDVGLFLNDEVVTQQIQAMERGADQVKAYLKEYSGVLYVEKFGEEPFSPQPNEARVTLDETQQKSYQTLMMKRRQLIESHIPEKERSFCIIAFPTPEIGEDFEAIFEAIYDVNTLDSEMYETIQQKIIDALDEAEYVVIKGVEGNDTDIKVKMHSLEDPSKQTNFVNCVADVNIPVGEVFTSPVLEGTHGVLHVADIYLNDFRFKDLKLTFVDGVVSEYTCSNFADETENKKYVEENLMFPHKALPIGEFAIGTNTLAYVVAEKFKIQDKLPILIIEKMGPHFAIGDTCFSFGEDNPVYNPMDGKEIIARDNSWSIKRKEDISKAYTNVHTDITLPYDALATIHAERADGTVISIIEKGRFVLAGTEQLNEAFEK